MVQIGIFCDSDKSNKKRTSNKVGWWSFGSSRLNYELWQQNIWNEHWRKVLGAGNQLSMGPIIALCAINTSWEFWKSNFQKEFSYALIFFIGCLSLVMVNTVNLYTFTYHLCIELDSSDSCNYFSWEVLDTGSLELKGAVEMTAD